jgi:hypothetical protein
MSEVYTAAQILGCGRPVWGGAAPISRYVLGMAGQGGAEMTVTDIVAGTDFEAIAIDPFDPLPLVPCWFCGTARPVGGRVYVGVGRWQCVYRASQGHGLSEGCRPRLLELEARHAGSQYLTAGHALKAAADLVDDLNRSAGDPSPVVQARWEICRAVLRFPRVGRMVIVSEDELAAIRHVAQAAVDYWLAQPDNDDYQPLAYLAESALLADWTYTEQAELPVFRETGDGVWLWKSTVGHVQVARTGGSAWRVRWPGEPGRPNQNAVAFMGTVEATIRASRALLAQVQVNPTDVTTR